MLEQWMIDALEEPSQHQRGFGEWQQALLKYKLEAQRKKDQEHLDQLKAADATRPGRGLT
jgi:hypothetical protein